MGLTGKGQSWIFKVLAESDIFIQTNSNRWHVSLQPCLVKSINNCFRNTQHKPTPQLKADAPTYTLFYL